MSKAVEKANKAYPVSRGSGIDRVISMVNRKNGYIQGYKQAEKDLADAFQAEYAKELARADLALTWKDIRLICEIDEDMRHHSEWPLQDQGVYYEEVLRRFREMKNK